MVFVNVVILSQPMNATHGRTVVFKYAPDIWIRLAGCLATFQNPVLGTVKWLKMPDISARFSVRNTMTYVAAWRHFSGVFYKIKSIQNNTYTKSEILIKIL